MCSSVKEYEDKPRYSALSDARKALEAAESIMTLKTSSTGVELAFYVLKRKLSELEIMERRDMPIQEDTVVDLHTNGL